MSQAHVDLWPSSFGSATQELPDTILNEQAVLLAEKTNHLVEARVRAPEHAKYLSDKIRLAFYLVAPKLGNYSYRLFTIEYEITTSGQEISGYPVTLSNGEEYVCRDREDFISALRGVLTSQTTVQIISTMMDNTVL